MTNIGRIFLGLFLALSVVFLSCEKMFFEENLDDTPETIFEIYWNDLNNHYPFFESMNVDWDSSYHANRSKVSGQTTNLELLDILSDMICPLKDGHLIIYTQYGNYGYIEDWSEYYNSKRIALDKYLINFKYSSQNIDYSLIVGHNIGYIYINSFEGINSGLHMMDKNYLIIDDIIKAFKDEDGIIIDVRCNHGGFSLNAETIASRFTDIERVYGWQKTKNGPGKNDFSDWSKLYIKPQGPAQFTKSVVVITSRETASAAEYFTLAMKSLPNTTVVGDTTQGAISWILWREMANGWTYGMPTTIVATIDYNVYNGKGLSPDITVLQTEYNYYNSVDQSIDKAIDVIENKRK